LKLVCECALVAGLALALIGAADAQPVQPIPTVSVPVADRLASSPIVTLDNGLITARIALPDPGKGFYRGTRFDQAGVITSLRLNGREFYGPWFDRTAPDVLDYVYDAAGAVVAGPDSATSGPVEEFAPLDFTPSPGLFVKIGVGVLRQPDNEPYDHYRHYTIENGGEWIVRKTNNQIVLSQSLKSGKTAYTYEKTLRLVPGKPELVIEHRLRNIGGRPISTTVYDHNFLRIVKGNAGVRITFPFTVSAANPPGANLIQIQGNVLNYLRPMAFKERISFPITGYGITAKDYDFRVDDTATGAGVRIQGDQPLNRINIFSIDKVQSVEPYIAIDLAPGAEKQWSYAYTFAAP
jgi:hypothetical protein